MSERAVYHIVPDSHHLGRYWKLEKEESGRHVLKLFLTKRDAVSYGRDLASKHCPSQLIIHEIDGRFEEEITY